MKKLFMLCSLLSVWVLGGCQDTVNQDSKPVEQSEKISVVTTFYPMYYMTKTIAGDVADVDVLLEKGMDAHHYEPSAKDIAKIDNAAVFVYSGEAMESWVPQVESGLGERKKVSFVEASQGIEMLEANAEHNHHTDAAHEHEEQDPHVWLDPVTVQVQVNNIAAALIQVDPKNKAAYEKNRDDLMEKLEELAKAYQEAFATAKNKVFMTQHAAFGYIAHRFGLEQVSVSGLQNMEPTAQEVAHAIEEIKAHQLSVVYVEPSSSQSIAKVISAESGITFEPLYTLEAEVSGKDYLQVLSENLTALKKTIK